MENYYLGKDISVCYIITDFAPEAILKAHQKLQAIIPYTKERRYFGVSCPNENGIVIYKAAAEELKLGEAKQLGLETLVLEKGNYTSIVLKEYKKDIPGMATAFSKLLQNEHIDPQGYCVEWYLNDDDVRCMVRLMK